MTTEEFHHRLGPLAAGVCANISIPYQGFPKRWVFAAKIGTNEAALCTFEAKEIEMAFEKFKAELARQGWLAVDKGAETR